MDLKNQLEALLFSSGKAMAEEQLCQITGGEKRSVKNALKKLQKEYRERDTALKLFEEGGTWKLLVKDEHIPLVRRIVADTELSRATMETLAVIAYHQPKVLQSKVVDLRGGNAYEQIAELERLGFVTKSKEGRSFSLKLTEKFYDYFDVEGEKGIHQVFKEVQAPLPTERQQKLGGLEVVDELPETQRRDEERAKRELLGSLEVVDEPEGAERGEESDEAPGSGESGPAKLERDVQGENDFLAKIEAQIDEISKRNDTRAEDPDFKSSAPPEEMQGEGGAAEGEAEGVLEGETAAPAEAEAEAKRVSDEAPEETPKEKPEQAPEPPQRKPLTKRWKK